MEKYLVGFFKQKNCKSKKSQKTIEKKWKPLDSLNVWENDLNPKRKLQKQIKRSNSKHGKVEVIWLEDTNCHRLQKMKAYPPNP